jgi:hypothetical protein
MAFLPEAPDAYPRGLNVEQKKMIKQLTRPGTYRLTRQNCCCGVEGGEVGIKFNFAVATFCTY